MPKDNIERAISRAINKESGELEEVVYEGFAPGGVSIIVEAATDNSMRTTSEIKSIFNKAGASFGQPGSVSYQFNIVGKIAVLKEGKSMDDIFLAAAESGADDIEEGDRDEVFIYTKPAVFQSVKEIIQNQGLIVTGATLIRKAIILFQIKEKEKAYKLMQFIEKLEALDDVQNVYTNAEFIES